MLGMLGGIKLLFSVDLMLLIKYEINKLKYYCTHISFHAILYLNGIF